MRQKLMNGFSKTYTTIARHLLCGMVESVTQKPMNGYSKTDERLFKNRWVGVASGSG